jgi:dTDP-4-amino-4,6-dideoxygalactose transaminase
VDRGAPHGHVYHLYVIRTAARAQWQEALQSDGIQTGIHYPIPVHRMPAYADLVPAGASFPHAERAAAEVLSLPMFPEISAEQCETVARALRSLASAGR